MKKEYYSVPEFETDPTVFDNLPVCTRGVKGVEDGTIVGTIQNTRVEDRQLKVDFNVDDIEIEKIIKGN